MSRSRFGKRPEDRVTIEEIRLAIAALAGPMRMVSGGSHQLFTLVANTPLEIARNNSAWSLFVDVRPIENVAIGVCLFSPSASGNPQTAIAADLSASIFQQILLEAESLWIQSAIATTILVSEVQV